MRKRSLLILTALAIGLIGCVGQNGPAETPKVTPEQIEIGIKEQQKAADEEMAHRKSERKSNKSPTK